MNPTISAVQNFLKTASLRPDGKILAAVSGGADSVAMLHVLCKVGGTVKRICRVEAQRRRKLGRGQSDRKTGDSDCKTGDSYLFSDTPAVAASASEPISQSKIENRKSKILCAHINHQLRGADSDADEQFTAELCKKLHIPFFAERIDVKTYAAQKKLSIETAARQLRLDALVRIARRTGCQYIATAHHKDDQAETVLFRLLRGTAFAGLAGIRPVIERTGLQWIRPMLHIRRTQIESYCRQNNLSWRDDASNLQTHFRRNWIRHRLLPLMQQNSENDLTEKLAALAQSALSLQRQVEKSANKIFQSSIINHQLSIDQTEGYGSLSPRPNACPGEGMEPKSSDDKMPPRLADNSQLSIIIHQLSMDQAGPFVAGEILRIALNHLRCGLRDISLSHYQRFFRLLDKTRAVLELPGGCTIRKKSDTLIFETVNSPKEPCFAPDALKLSINNNQLSITRFGPWRIQTRTIQITQNDLAAFQKSWKTGYSTAALGCDNFRVAATERSEVDGSLLFPRPVASKRSKDGKPESSDGKIAPRLTEISQSKIENRKSSISFRQWFDLAKIQAPIVVRCRQKDDSFIPFGRKTSKKISRFLTDSQIDPKQKASCFVIEDKTGVLWLAPLRRSVHAVVDKDTAAVLEIRVEKI